MSKHDPVICGRAAAPIAGSRIAFQSPNGRTQSRRWDAVIARRVITLVSAALALAACSQNAWKADESRYPTKAQQEAAFERHSERCQMRSRVIRTPSQSMTDTQTYRPENRVELDRALFRACMADAGFTLASSEKKTTPPPPEKATQPKPEEAPPPAPEKTAETPAEASKDKVAPVQAATSDVVSPPSKSPPETVPMPQQDTAVVEKTAPTAAMVAANAPYRIQLGSFRTRAAAEKEWTRLQTALPDLFASKEPIIAKATLPGRGIFYRLQNGGFDTMEKARSTCATLRAKKLACFPLRKS